MRRVTAAALAAFLVVCASPRAAAAEEGDDLEQIPSCGAIVGETKIWQLRPGELLIAGFSETTRNVDGCLSKVRVEAWIDGTSVSSLVVDERWGSYAGFQWTSVRVQRYGTWNAQGKHFVVNFGQRLLMNYSHGEAELTEGDPDPPDEDAEDPPDSNGETCDTCSPIIIDPEHDGYALTTPEDGVLFDIDADGTLDRVAWTRADSDDVFLALDRNGNGRIDDGSELFGDRSPAFADGSRVTAPNGFVALDMLQGSEFGASYADRVIDARDQVFGRLLLWRDANHNGLSELDELTPAAAAGLYGIGLDYKESRRRDPHGNEFRQRAKAAWADGAFYIYDVWLRTLR